MEGIENDIFAPVRAILAEIAKSQAETNIQMTALQKSQAETSKQMAETDKQIRKHQAETSGQIAALQKAQTETYKQIGGMQNSHGYYAEEFFYNTIFYGKKTMFGEKFDDVLKQNIVTANRGYEDEYDILLINGRAICVVEVKYKADSSDLIKKVLRKATTFRANFPQHSNKTIYLALAALSFHPITERECIDNGIAIIKQVGDAVAIYDENIKKF